MIVLLRSLIVWLMLLALPYQGYASAAMMLCAPASSSAGTSTRAMPAGPHDHAAMMAAMTAIAVHRHDAHENSGRASHDSATTDPVGDAVASSGAGHSGHDHGGAKCGGAACCVAGAPMMALAIAVPALPAVSSAVPFHSEVLHAVDLAHPERPPQGNFV